MTSLPEGLRLMCTCCSSQNCMFFSRLRSDSFWVLKPPLKLQNSPVLNWHFILSIWAPLGKMLLVASCFFTCTLHFKALHCPSCILWIASFLLIETLEILVSGKLSYIYICIPVHLWCTGLSYAFLNSLGNLLQLMHEENSLEWHQNGSHKGSP